MLPTSLYARLDCPRIPFGPHLVDLVATKTQRIRKPCMQTDPAEHGFEQQNVGHDAIRSADDEHQSLHAGTSQQCKDLQRQTMDDTTCYTTDQQTPSTHRRGDLANVTTTVTPGTEQVTQGTTEIHVAIVNPLDGHTQATHMDLRQTC